MVQVNGSLITALLLPLYSTYRSKWEAMFIFALVMLCFAFCTSLIFFTACHFVYQIHTANVFSQYEAAQGSLPSYLTPIKIKQIKNEAVTNSSNTQEPSKIRVLSTLIRQKGDSSWTSRFKLQWLPTIGGANMDYQITFGPGVFWAPDFNEKQNKPAGCDFCKMHCWGVDWQKYLGIVWAR